MGGRGASSGARERGIKVSESVKELKSAQEELKMVRKALSYRETKDLRDFEDSAVKRLEVAEKAVKDKKPGSLPQQITDYFFTQVGVDLSKHDMKTTRRFGGGVIVDWKHMDKVTQRAIERALYASYSKYRMEEWSGYQMFIRKRRPDEPF